MVDAVAHARLILSWHEHLTEKELPPRWMWTLEEELERHFDQVKSKREAGTVDSDDDDEPGLTVHNEYAKGRGRSR